MNTIFDQQHIRRAFPHSAGIYDEASALAQEVQQLMRQFQISVGAT